MVLSIALWTLGVLTAAIAFGAARIDARAAPEKVLGRLGCSGMIVLAALVLIAVQSVAGGGGGPAGALAEFVMFLLTDLPFFYFLLVSPLVIATGVAVGTLAGLASRRLG